MILWFVIFLKKYILEFDICVQNCKNKTLILINTIPSFFRKKNRENTRKSDS